MVFTKNSVSLFPLFSETTPTHLYNILHRFLFREKGKWNVTKPSHVLIIDFMIYSSKTFKSLEKMETDWHL